MSTGEASDRESGETDMEVRKLSPRSGSNSALLSIPSEYVDKLGGPGHVILVDDGDGRVVLMAVSGVVNDE